MALHSFAKEELARAGLFDADSDYAGELGASVMRLIDVFAAEGHSGGSAFQSLELFSRLASFTPITPLTGEDDEWNEVGEQNGGPLFQSRRCATVFKDVNGAYDIARDRREAIEFPYSPAR